LSAFDLPAINAALNGLALCLLITGYVFIKRGKQIRFHKFCMISAFITSSAFLVSYLVYHYQVGSVPFAGQGWVRPLYFIILISHIILAGLIPPLALVTLYLGLRGEFSRHVRIARWTWPTWLYVSVTGVLIYWMLYKM
jgi:putative membrane protein